MSIDNEILEGKFLNVIGNAIDNYNSPAKDCASLCVEFAKDYINWCFENVTKDLSQTSYLYQVEVKDTLNEILEIKLLNTDDELIQLYLKTL